MSILLPPSLVPGDVVWVVAPSSAFPNADFWRGMAWLRDRYRLRSRTSVLAREGYLAGDDGSRARLLAEAMLDVEAKAIIAARGGYGAMRLLEEPNALPWDAFVRAPKWMIGFSDITALHVEVAARGIASIHGPNVTGLGRDASPWTRARFLASLERPHASHEWSALRVLHGGGGRAEGALFGGNLALLEAMAAAGRLRIPEGAILVLEDVSERPYRIDRMLTSLRLGGHLAAASAIVLGEFADCVPGPDGVRALDVLVDRTASLRIPVLADAPTGHGARNDAFVLGASARVVGSTVMIGREP